MPDVTENSEHAPCGWRSLAIPALIAVGLLNYLDRALPAVLAEPMKRDLGLSDTFFGVINGFGFLLLYAIAGIPIARVADRDRESVVISAALKIWSLMKLAGGIVASGWQLVLTRMGVALGEAGSLPASHAYLTRRYPPEQRTMALSMLSLAVRLGSSIDLLSGGVLGRWTGWRATFAVIGGIGIALAPQVLLALTRANTSREDDPSTATIPSGSFGYVTDLGDKAGLRLILAEASLLAIGAYAASAFVPAFLMGVHGLTLQMVGIRFGLAARLVGVATLLLTGWWSDKDSCAASRLAAPCGRRDYFANRPMLRSRLHRRGCESRHSVREGRFRCNGWLPCSSRRFSAPLGNPHQPCAGVSTVEALHGRNRQSGPANRGDDQRIEGESRGGGAWKGGARHSRSVVGSGGSLLARCPTLRGSCSAVAWPCDWKQTRPNNFVNIVPIDPSPIFPRWA